MRCLALACLLLVVGCDRVPIDSEGTSLLVTSPDLGVVLLEPTLRLRLVPDGTSGPVTVRVSGAEVPFDSAASAFVYERALSRGLNTLLLTVTNTLGTVRDDTLYALHLPLEVDRLVDANAGVARAEAAVAPLGDGRAMVSGGRGASGQALASADLLALAPSRVEPVTVPLLRARAGHSATSVLGGTLLLGGADGAPTTGAAAFVRQPEWVGPSGETRLVEVVGEAEGPARAGHVAQALSFENETYLYLLGGLVPSGGGAVASPTVDIYRVDGASGFDFRLERLSPPGGTSGFAAVPNGALAASGAASASVFGLGASGDASTFALRWSTPGTSTSPFSLTVQPAAPLRTPRTGAAALDLGGGLALVVGGRDADGDPVGTLEVYAAQAGRSFRLPPERQLLVPRSDHIATIFGTSRIVVAGGRPANGSAIVAYEGFQF